MLIELLVVVWACFSIRAYKNAVFNLVIPDKKVLAKLAAAANLSFAPGLLKAMQAATPPPIEFFLRLPSEALKVWAIYVIVLWKDGFPYLIYIGSATEAIEGLKGRWRSYEKLHPSTPYYVARALRDGFVVVHKGTLISAPIPRAADVPRRRVLFVALEAALTFLFWAVKSQKSDHFMLPICPWSLDSFTYTGLCSHSPLQETVLGDFELTPEQLEAVAAERAARRSGHVKRYVAANPEVVKATKKRSHDKVKASNRYRCELCKISCAKG